MPFDVLISLMVFCLVAAVTPGPNNVMLMASGANFGFRRTLPHMTGIVIGGGLMILAVGIGMLRLFDVFPPLRTAIQVASVGYLLYLAWKIANAAPPETSTAEARPLTALQAAAFQWINPKAWTVGMSAHALFAASRELAAVGTVALAFAVAGVVGVSIWTALGQQVRRLLASPDRLRVFNWVMAALLVASLYPVVAEALTR